MHIGIVAGEASGDILGAGLIQAIKARYPECRFSGIGGKLMLQHDFKSLYPQDRLAVMGFIEPLKRLPELLAIRKSLYHYFLNQKVDVVVGIDSPDFNLTLEKNCRKDGMQTVHYVSPSVWAWRQGRIKLIKQAVDHMLTLLPFEAGFYEQHQVPVTFVGHPLADQFPEHNDPAAARQQLQQSIASLPNLDNKKMIACLPGSRSGEVKHIGNVLWRALQLLTQTQHVEVLVPAANAQRKQQIEQQLLDYPELPITVVDGESQTVMAAADVVVMASGTTTLEAMLLKKPMVVVYKKDALSYALISRMLRVKHISLPNLLAGESLVPELLQDKATPEAISQAVSAWLDNPDKVTSVVDRFKILHQQLQGNASETAANLIVKLADKTHAH